MLEFYVRAILLLPGQSSEGVYTPSHPDEGKIINTYMSPKSHEARTQMILVYPQPCARTN
jgi:hypothetical protein